MKSLKYIIILMCTLFVFGCSTGNGAKGNDLNTSGSDIYITEMSFVDHKISVKVGDKLDVSTLELNILPSNAKISPTIELRPTTKAVKNGNVVTFLDVGEVELVARALGDKGVYKTATLICEISKAPIFAVDVAFQYRTITFDINDTAINKLIISPETYNQGVVVSYVNNNKVANYDYITGVLTPVRVGTGTISVQLKSDENKTIYSSFDVSVTNNVYANSIDNITLNNKAISDEITLYTGDSGELNYTVLPNDFNMNSTISTNNNLISFNGKNFVVGNVEGESIINISAQKVDGNITKSIKVNIVKIPAEIDFKLYENNNSNGYYTNTEYILEITTELSDYSKVVFDNCNFEYLNENKYKVKFTKAGNVKINAVTTVNGLVSSKTVYGERSYRVYNPILDINFSLRHQSELIHDNGVYTLYLPNLELLDSAIADNELVYADLNISARGLYTNSTSLSYSIEGDSVILNGNRIIANKLGQSKIVVKSADEGKFTREYIVDVKPLEVREIVCEDNIQLYLNGDNIQKDNVTICPTVVPSCAYNTNVIISKNNNNVQVVDNKIMALSGGKSSVTLSCGNVSKIVNINITYIPTHMVVYLNGCAIKDGNMYTCELGAMFNLAACMYSNDVALAGCNFDVKINGVSIVFEANNKLSFNETGEYLIEVSYMDLTVSFTIKVTLVNKILSFNFEQNEYKVNTFVAEECKIKPEYSMVLQHQNIASTDTISFVSTNENIAKIDGEYVNIVGVGTATIEARINGEKVDEFTILAYSKEVYQIASLSDFCNIESGKNYIVTSDIDFDTFSLENSKNFNAEIDFNNKVISNLKWPLFLTLGQNAIVKNLVVSGQYSIDVVDAVSNAEYGLSMVAISNNGVIDNVSFRDYFLSITNNQELTDYVELNLIAYSNLGTISNILYDDASIVVLDTNATSVNSYKISGAANENYGEITDVCGNLSLSGFTKAAGLVITHYGSLSDVDLTINYTCTQENKVQIAGLVHKTMLIDNDSCPTFENITLNIVTENSSGCTSLTFAGLVYTNNYVDGQNVTISHQFDGEFDENKTHLMFYTNETNNLTEVSVSSNYEYQM